MSVQSVASALGLTSVHVQRLTRAGVLPKIGHGKYDLEACVSAYSNYKAEQEDGETAPPELIEERTRLTAAQASLAEFRLKEETSKYARIDDVREYWQDFVSVASNRLRLLTSVDLESSDDPMQVEFRLRRAVYLCLEDLAVEETHGREGIEGGGTRKEVETDEPLNLETEKIRLTAAQASLAELKLSVERGEVVLVEGVQASWTNRVSSCRAKILSLPTRLAPLLVSSSPERVAATIDKHIDESLTELAI